LIVWVHPLLQRGHPDFSYIQRVDAHFIYLSHSYRSCEGNIEDRKDKKNLRCNLKPSHFLRGGLDEVVLRACNYRKETKFRASEKWAIKFEDVID
jgi:hypothetical protein